MKGWHSRFLWREFWAGRSQLALFAVCVVLASLSLSVVSGWRQSVDDAMAEETRKGAGGDVVAFSTEPFSQDLKKTVQNYPHIRTWEMFTVTLAPTSDLTLFSKLKAVEPGYPYYGEVPLQSGRNIHEALKEGVVMEKRALQRLEIEVGDEVKIGTRFFKVADMALSEPDRPLGMWGVSPRVFISFPNLDKTELIRPGSYAERRFHIKLDDPQKADQVAEVLRQAALPDQERVETWQRPPVNMERYVENFFTFLDMMAVLAIALGGLGMQSTLSAWLGSREQTVATVRALGATRSFVLRHYSAIVLASTAVGYLLGLAAAAYLLFSSGEYLTQMLPVQVTPALSITAALESAFLCLLVALSFASWPLYTASRVRPGALLRKEQVQTSRLSRSLFLALVFAAIFILLLTLIANLKKALFTLLALTMVSAITGAVSLVLVKWLKTRKPSNLALRTALGSWRSPEARSELVVFIVSTCLAVLYTAVLCEEALRQSWIEAMPPEAPNLIFLDIQPDQLEDFQAAVESPLKVYANMRVRVKDINGKPLDRSGKREYWQRDGRGKLDANPTTEIPENDKLISGKTLFNGEAEDQVSIREDMAEALEVGIGDTITFGVQGVPVTARVSSIRKSSRKGFQPSFELLFPPQLVEGAPRTIFASLRLPEDQIGALQTKLAKQFPGVVSMDLSLTIRLVSERLMQMVGLVQYFLWSGLFAGVLILVSATWSARQRRSREAAYYKAMGATPGCLARVVWLENLVLGAACSGLGLGLALTVSWGLCEYRMKVPFPEVTEWLGLMLIVPALTIALLGWLVGRKAITAKPAPYLRES